MGHLPALGWFVFSILALILLQRRLHYEMQVVFLLLTRRPEVAQVMFALMFFPGVLLHEISHYLMAHLLGVPTGRFALLPEFRPASTHFRGGSGTQLKLGYVETASVDLVRDALIGSAPLLAGGAFVLYAGSARLGLLKVWDGMLSGGLAALFQSLADLPAQPDFYLWFYLTFVISSMMLPSVTDRRAWLPLVLILVPVTGLTLLSGAGPWLAEHLGEISSRVLHTMTVTFGISAGVHLALLPPMWMLRRLLVRLIAPK